MTQQQRQHNISAVCDNSNNIELDYVEEECSSCYKHMTNIKYIYVDLDSGNYLCKSCSKDYNNVVKCMDL